MKQKKKITCIVPARLESTRFKNKVLETLAGKPILQWIYESATESELFDDIYFAVDAKVTKELAESFGAKAILTSVDHPSGTDRIIEVKESLNLDADIFVNWQADEPFIKKPLLQDLLQSVDEDSDLWTLKKRIEDPIDLEDSSVVKVVTDQTGKALYFSRHCIPYFQNDVNVPIYKHLGIYAYSKKALSLIKELRPCDLEKAESLEQLRFLYHGLKIKVHETKHETFGIDLKEHLLLAEKMVQDLSVT